MSTSPTEVVHTEIVHGRGAWPSSGRGGTINYKGDAPGAYYRMPNRDGRAAGLMNPGRDRSEPDGIVVHRAVKIYQRALNRRLGTDLVDDGNYGALTTAAVSTFQNKVGLAEWGGIGPETSKALLFPDLRRAVAHRLAALDDGDPRQQITAMICCGLITNESSWDAGAVGYLDLGDLGVGQVNKGANPEMTDAEREQPIVSFNFIFDHLSDSSKDPDLTELDDWIAAYNLGNGGASVWVRNGRPDTWQIGEPGPDNPPRHMGGVNCPDHSGYIDRIKAACSR